MKRILSVLLVAILIVTSLATVAFAEAIEVKTGDVKTVTVVVSGAEFQGYTVELSADAGLKIIDVEGATNNLNTGLVSWSTDTGVKEHSFNVIVEVTATEPGTYDLDASVKKAYNYVGAEKDTEDGIVDGLVAASVSASGASFVIPEPECEHNWGDWTVVKEATCTEDGLKQRVCGSCGEVEDEIIPAGHIWGEWTVVKEANCTDDGLKQRTCSRCGEVEEEVIPSAEGHAWGDWEIVKKADCTNDGLKQRVCGSCGEKQEEVIAATGHSIDKDWEYDSEGHWHICTKCGEKFDHDDHDLKELENSKGQKYKKCSVCPYATNPEGDSLEDVPTTGDITPMITTGILVLIGIVSVAAIVFKRKRAN